MSQALVSILILLHGYAPFGLPLPAFSSNKPAEPVAQAAAKTEMPWLHRLAEPSETELTAETELAEEGPSLQPHLLPLRRESVPVRRKGKVVSFKTSYSGVISMGQPAQPFRVVFDTGSGHLVLPAKECNSEACVVHKQYDMLASKTASPINADGSFIEPGQKVDTVSIGFGTGTIRGQFVNEMMCLGEPRQGKQPGTQPSNEANATDPSLMDPYCVHMRGVMAIQMSTQPFKNFGFDGILGMGLGSLALSKEFSFSEVLGTKRRLSQKAFGVFLTDDDHGEQSEIAIGGHNSARLLTPLSWTDVIMPEAGYWQIQITAVRVGGKELDVCKDGTCRGVIDTGTSHLGLPAPFDKDVVEMLTAPAGKTLDCRLADLPELQIELPGINITLTPDTYMRRLPLREDVDVDVKQGVSIPEDAELMANLETTTTTTALVWTANDERGQVPTWCKPKLMPVNMPAPLGPKFFILGEPVLHRYYTVFDWSGPRVGMGVANKEINKIDRARITDRIGSLPRDVDNSDLYLMQQKVTADIKGTDGEDAHVYMQVVFKVSRLKVTPAPC